MTYQQAAQTALDVQDAVNLSGIVRSFNEVCQTLWNEARRIGKGTEWVNNHPIVTLFLDKLTSLHLNGDSDVFKVFEQVKVIAGK